ncbi:murein hydrolase activator EnvC [Anoxybacillus sp. P3H1B]|uniref:murein hydrolase activator EnvC family protein n=1 Tax=Anoxybacillus sp. P3H1B TaxID=1769293 RepID=UPI00082426B8|nr:peptidoglycan DD-metalloendopeptidase family protein [Anoxybacillus sp. P3H1B]
MVKQKVLSLAAAAVIGASSFSPYLVGAVSNQEIQQKRNAINNIQSKQSSIQNQMSQADQDITRLQSQQEKLAAEIKKLDMTVSETSGKIRELSATIEDTKQDIQVLQREIAEVKERIEKRNELLKERVRSLQQSGGLVSYLDVLLGAQSFGDFIDRISAVTTIFEADKQIIAEQEADKKLKEGKENELTTKLASLQSDLQKLQQLKQQLSQQIKEKDQLMAQLEKQEQDVHEKKLALAEEQEVLKKQEAAMKAQLQQLLIQQQQQAAKAKSTASQTSSSSGPSYVSGGGSAGVPAVTSGAFMRPANGPVTSGFGMRGGEFHAGVDIGKRAAEVPVVAAADGYVFRSYYSQSYGNVVFITHVINGQVYTTVYAHLESRLAHEGQTVKKGQIIGYMGNTGWSEGAHLHFELHRGPWNAAKSNAVNPLNYINF